MKALDDFLLEKIVERILQVATPEKIILFGSYARGEVTHGSDIDLLIVQASDLPRYKRSTPIRLALKGVFPAKDIVIYTPEEVEKWKTASTSLVATALREGKVLYERQ